MELLLSILPIALLIYLMVKPNPLPSFIALPSIATLVYVLQVFYFQSANLVTINANLLAGVVSVFTPTTVIFGAILFNKFLESSGALATLKVWMGAISPNPVAQLMIIGWAFGFMIEGASGFGTPAAIAAPLLVGLGFEALPVAIFALVMNSVPVSFGAVGTPTWFGLAPLIKSGAINDTDLLQIGGITALIHCVAALVVPLIGLLFIVKWEVIKRNIVFIYLSILACCIPYYFLAQFNYEFPSLIGGAVGVFITAVLAFWGVGLEKSNYKINFSDPRLNFIDLIKACIPTGILVSLLLITRIQQLPFKAMLNDATTWISIPLGAIGNFEISQGLIFSLKNIFGTNTSDSYKLLYVPALIPFVVAVFCAWTIFTKVISVGKMTDLFVSTALQTRKTFIALLGALIMVKLMMVGGENAMVQIIGKGLAQATGEAWQPFASLLGAVGSFFSGSNTVSNLTFGAVQYSVAVDTGLNKNIILALQSVGGAMGNMVCINNIIAVASVLSLQNAEGSILKKTIIPMLVYAAIAALASYFVVPLFFHLN